MFEPPKSPETASTAEIARRHRRGENAFGQYVEQLRNSLQRGTRLSFESDYWHRPEIHVEEASICDVMCGGGSALTLVINESDPEGSDIPYQVHLENWALNCNNAPQLDERCTIISPVIESSASDNSSSDSASLTEEQDTIIKEAFTELAYKIAAWISTTSARGTTFSSDLQGNHWQEIAGSGSIIVLARRSGPRPRKTSPPSMKHEGVRVVLYESAFESSTASETSMESDLDVGPSDTSELCFSQSEEQFDNLSEAGSVALSSIGGDHEEKLDDIVDDFDEALSDNHSENTDSDESIAHLDEETGGSCNICGEAMSFRLHCDKCNHGNFDMCRGCWSEGAWCKNEEHSLSEYSQWIYSSGREMDFDDLLPEQELIVLENGFKQTPKLHFVGKSQMIPSNSPPVLHPSRSLVAWYLGENCVLLGSHADGDFITYEVYSLPKNAKGVFGHVYFSPCGRLLHALILAESIDKKNSSRSQDGQQWIVNVHHSSHILSSDTALSSPTLALHRELPYMFISRGPATSYPPFAVTWTPEYAYLTIDGHRMNVFRVDIREEIVKSSPEGGKDLEVEEPSTQRSKIQSEAATDILEPIRLPANAVGRMGRFFPHHDGGASILIRARNGSKIAPPFVTRLTADHLGPWEDPEELLNPKKVTNIELLMQDIPASNDKEFVLKDVRIRFQLVRQEDGKKTYKSLDGRLRVEIEGRNISTTMDFVRNKRGHYGIEFSGERYAMNLITNAPFSEVEVGAYWRLLSGSKPAISSPYTLCKICTSFRLSPTDFVQDNCEEYDDWHPEIPKTTAKYFYSFLCDSCGIQEVRPCVSYKCRICNKGGYDLCETCFESGKHCYDRRHELRKTTYDLEYRDREIAEALNILHWTGRLGIPEEVKKRTFCPLCRLVARSIDGIRVLNAPKDDQSQNDTTEENKVSLKWKVFGWNQERRQTQGRYLFAETAGKTGAPMMLLSECHPFAPFTARRQHTDTIHIPTLQSWLNNCEKNHGWECSASSHNSEARIRKFTVIDVEDWCLVTLSSLPRFVALSYVWGKVNQFQASKSNVGRLHQKNYLKRMKSRLSRTIVDAIEFTRQMDEIYLWVDALCIVQDDQDSVKGSTDQMDLIYGSAAFTIIAAAGENVESGIPGIRPGSRRPEQYIENINFKVKLLLLPSAEAKLERSVHQTRGWTFQETLLSRRRFIFLDDLVYFQCERRMCREDFCDRRPDVVSSLLQNADRYTSANAYFSGRSGRHYNSGGILERLTQAYSRRFLSVESDIIRGFQGILNNVQQRLGIHFLEGMPMEFLDSALLWAPKRQIKKRLGFPSFSWAGWTGEPIWPAHDGIPHPFIRNSLNDDNAWYVNSTYIEWHQTKNGGISELIRSGSNPAYSRLTSEMDNPKSTNKVKKLAKDAMGRPMGLDWDMRYGTKGKGKKTKENIIRPEKMNPREVLPPQPDGGVQRHQEPPTEVSLGFAAVVINVLLGESSIESQHADIFRFLALRCQCGSTHGYVAVPDQFECEANSEGSLIILSNGIPGAIIHFSKGRLQEPHWKKKEKLPKKLAFHVMLVEWNDGVAERIGMGILERDALTCKISDSMRWGYVLLR